MQVIERDGLRRDIEPFDGRKIKKLLREDPQVKKIEVFNLERGMKITIAGVKYKVIKVRPDGKVVLKRLGKR